MSLMCSTQTREHFSHGEKKKTIWQGASRDSASLGKPDSSDVTPPDQHAVPPGRIRPPQQTQALRLRLLRDCDCVWLGFEIVTERPFQVLSCLHVFWPLVFKGESQGYLRERNVKFRFQVSVNSYVSYKVVQFPVLITFSLFVLHR